MSVKYIQGLVFFNRRHYKNCVLFYLICQCCFRNQTDIKIKPFYLQIQKEMELKDISDKILIVNTFMGKLSRTKAK